MRMGREESVTMSDYYDWQKTFTYDADVTMVVGARGLGKTYGLRKQFVKDYENHKWRFAEITRTKTEAQAVMQDYFSKVGKEYPQYIFKYEKMRVYIALKPENDSAKPKWDVLGYFLAMTQEQQIKKMSSSFVDVRRIVLDEAILDRHDRYHKYLPREWAKLSGIVDSVSRERSGSLKPKVYLLGNALDLMNPYFDAAKIDDYTIKPGYSWHRNKTFLLHYVKDARYSQEKNENTVAGRMLADTYDALETSANEFVILRGDFVVSRKPKAAQYKFGIVCAGIEYGVYECMKQGYFWIDSKIKDKEGVTFAITTDDMKLNRLQARKAERALMLMSELHYQSLLRYKTSNLQRSFMDVLNRFGVRY